MAPVTPSVVVHMDAQVVCGGSWSLQVTSVPSLKPLMAVASDRRGAGTTEAISFIFSNKATTFTLCTKRSTERTENGACQMRIKTASGRSETNPA